ncbi:hypothetical protein BDQ12DRAFT_737778 [Crucibulum laeve]|uniref:PROP1-like PPR domain-containing protein n=1 Tax=Crucibulum laeve TaxID=68775 RepID=A0A5C3LQG5_9AGAR|nr:hypothetical protein BDQ12DRAFT_737778 [Crucibulum laeve]
MLPKVATHILHTTTRAVTVVQNQTHTFRNVLQLQSSGPSGSGSNRGGNGPGPGSSKHNTGSRFYSGFNGAGRAVTQANAVTSNDGQFTQNDDNEQVVTRRPALKSKHKRTRIRSSSLSLSVQARNERGEKLGVLKTVQLHARSRHAFALQSTTETALTAPESAALRVRRNSTSSSDGLDAPSSPTGSVRHKSTSTRTDINSKAVVDLPPPSPAARPTSPLPKSTDPASPQTTLPPAGPTQSSSPVSSTPDYVKLLEARNSGDPHATALAVRQFRDTTAAPIVQEFNMALEALYETRQEGESLHLILETYNDMLKHSILPNLRTYYVLIEALTARDHEMHSISQMLEMRVKQQQLTGRLETATLQSDKNRITSIAKENNFGSAMSLFESVLAVGLNQRLPLSIYIGLLRSCANHGNIESAIHVFGQLEKRGTKIGPLLYQHLLQTFVTANDLAGAEAVFNEYITAGKAGRIDWPEDTEGELPNGFRRNHLKIWNSMVEAYFRAGFPEKAVDIVHQMISSTAGTHFGPGEVPITASSTFTNVLNGFIQMGDVSTALIWFDRLLQQGQIGRSPYHGLTGEPMKPDSVAWSIMLDALATHGMVDDLHRVFKILLRDGKADGVEVREVDRIVVFKATLEHIKDMDNERAGQTVQFLLDDVLDDSLSAASKPFIEQACEAYCNLGMYQQIAVTLSKLFDSELAKIENIDEGRANGVYNALWKNLFSVSGRIYERAQSKAEEDVPFAVVVQLARLAYAIEANPHPQHAPHLLHAYGRAKQADAVPFEQMSHKEWEHLLESATYVESMMMAGNPVKLPIIRNFAFEGIISLLRDISSREIAFESFGTDLRRRTIALLSSRCSREQLEAIGEELGPSYQAAIGESIQLQQAALEEALAAAAAAASKQTDMIVDAPVEQKLKVDLRQNSYVEQPILKTDRMDLAEAYRRFEKGLTLGKAPRPTVVGRLIQGFGRVGDLERVRHLYTVGQRILEALVLHPDFQRDGWFALEDSMIIALAHSGDVDSAHVHRYRMLEQGGAPSADAYGILILHVKDTTDDTSNALSLFQESQLHGVTPNQYLYNNVISKLSKARKADYALELFQQMKANRIQPSSITFGAVISACARVGDVHSAELLFTEMTQARNFRPRIPPYNTMMQAYTTTKPNRERALHYYEALKSAGVAPTAHTYKLLLDAYGAIEPVDVTSMEGVFSELLEDSKAELQSTHFASLINAYGCVLKDLDKAISVFDSIPSYNKPKLMDAVVFEAIINVAVAHRRTDLISEYITKMSEVGVHMTAYIANFLIKGYANGGYLKQAREVFESLADPPSGVAAPNNHAPHDPTSSPEISPMDPVYREPSTWEAMVRAELGAGYRDEAIQLLERLRARQYPEAVYNRISGILVDHSAVMS